MAKTEMSIVLNVDKKAQKRFIKLLDETNN